MDENRSDVIGPPLIVGFEDEALKIMERLVGKPKHLDLISIVGMPGLGKTTLALKVYNDPYVAHHFYIRAWVSVSQVYNKMDLLLGIFKSPHILNPTQTQTQRDVINEMSYEMLKEELYKRLKGNRYLIFFDDIWNIEAWDDLKRCFPDDNNGSRIMFTTRIRDVALTLSANSIPHDLRFLSIDESWDLLQDKIFNKETCPPELMQLGKNIAENCRGLPLSIVTVGGFLSKLEKTKEQWTQVGKSIGSFLVGDSNQTTKTLELSYNHLPDHLKPLFLYFGAFPEDYEIPVTKMIWLWIAEGFINKSGAETVEDVAEGYLLDLIDRSLILIANRRSDGGVKSCRIHDLLHDLCLTKAKEENFMLIIHRWEDYSSLSSYSHNSSSTFTSPIGNKLHRWAISYCEINARYPFKHYPNILSLRILHRIYFLRQYDFLPLKLLRVLELDIHTEEELSAEIKQLVHLRYLALTRSRFSGSRYNLKTLETLVLLSRQEITSMDLSQMTEKLRHLHIRKIRYKGPIQPQIAGFYPFQWNHVSTFTNLQTMSTPIFTNSDSAILRTTPNLRKLRCIYGSNGIGPDLPELEFLFKLEKLHLTWSFYEKPFRKFFELPASLKHVTLSQFRHIDWENISKLARLPNLEVLKLRNFGKSLWDTSLLESDFQPFPKLKFLKFKFAYIRQWNACKDHFPRLQQLVLDKCYSLKEIPSELGDIPTLKKIEVRYCTHPLACSAREILEEQQSNGNVQLEVFIYPPNM